MDRISGAVQTAHAHKQSGVLDDNSICVICGSMQKHIIALMEIANPDTRLEGELVHEMTNRIVTRYEDGFVSRASIINYRGMLIQSVNKLADIAKATDGYRSLEFLFAGVDAGRLYKALIQAAQSAQNEQD